MNEQWDSRTRLLLGDDGCRRLREAHVLVVGVGGVGGYAAEMLARTGVGHLTLVDADCVAESNLNRQIIALRDSIGVPKVELFRRRIAEICPEIEVTPRLEFVDPESVGELLDSDRFDFVIDAIDTVAPKCALLIEALRRKIPVISSMGAGGRVDPTKIGYFDLWETRQDGLARAVRQRLKKAGMRRPLKVVASTDPPRACSVIDLDLRNKRSSYGTVAAIPSMFGIYLASYVTNRLSGIND